LVGKKDLLIQSYRLMKLSLSPYGHFEINKKIQSKIQYLNNHYNLTEDDLLQELFEFYLEHHHYEKFNLEKTKLSTFIVHYVNLRLNNLIQKYDTRERHYKEVPLPDNNEDALDEDHRSSLSLAYLEKLGLAEELIDRRTPEDYYMAKELFDLMVEFFGLNDTLVVLGMRDRKVASGRTSTNHKSYNTRLSRKLRLFRSMLHELGY